MNIRRGSLVVADNYYTTFSLVDMLLNDHGLYYLGTLRPNYVPSEIQLPPISHLSYGKDINNVIHLPYSQIEYQGCFVFLCRDITEFRIISNHPDLKNRYVLLHEAKINLAQLKTFRLNRQSNILFKKQLNTCKHYNQTMGAVDLLDRLLESYQFKRKTSKIVSSYLFYFLNIIIVNSYNLYKLYCQENDIIPMRHLMFRQNLSKQLRDIGADEMENTHQSNLMSVARLSKLDTPLNNTLINWKPYLLSRRDKITGTTINSYRTPANLKEQFF